MSNDKINEEVVKEQPEVVEEQPKKRKAKKKKEGKNSEIVMIDGEEKMKVEIDGEYLYFGL